MRTLYRAALLVAASSSLVITRVSAQHYSGSWSVQNRKGATVTLTLSQAPDGKLTGRMSGGEVEYTVEGMVQQGVAVGVMYQASGGVYFEATLTGSQLALTLIEPGPDRQPDYSRTRQLVLTSRGPTPGPTAPAPEPEAPAQAGAKGSLLGDWECQTTDGPARLSFQTDRQLAYNGTAMAYALVPGGLRVDGNNGPTMYQYRVEGQALEITGPDIRMQCRRGAAGPTPPPVAGGGGASLLYGQLCNYSSSSGAVEGGFSTLRVLSLDGQGRFQLGSEVSSSGPSGSAYGRNPAKVGHYRVEGATRGAAVSFTFDNGDVHRGEVYHVYQGRITELMVEGNLYATELCQ